MYKGEKYIYFTSSAGQIRTKKTVFIKESVWKKYEKTIMCGLTIDSINKKYCKNYKGFSSGLKIEKESFCDFFEGDFIAKNFRNDIPFTVENFIKRNLSSSFSPKETDENYSLFINELKKLSEKYETDGIVTLPNITKCFIGKVK